MGDMMNGVFGLVVGSWLSYSALALLAGQVGEVRRAGILRKHGRTAAAVIVSLGDLDPEASTRRAVVRFEAEPGRDVTGTVHLLWKDQPNLVSGAQVFVRYDPAAPTSLAPEAGRRQGRVEARQSVIISAAMLALVLPTSAYLTYAGLRILLF